MTISEDFLLTMAEIAIALMGFSGVVTALGRRDQGDWTPEEILQLRSQVEPSAVALFGACIPSILALLISDQLLLWRVANGLLAILVGYALIAYYVRTRSAKTVMSQKVMSTVSAFVLLGIVASALNVIAHHQLTFVSGILLGIAVGVHNFGLLLFGVEDAP